MRARLAHVTDPGILLWNTGRTPCITYACVGDARGVALATTAMSKYEILCPKCLDKQTAQHPFGAAWITGYAVAAVERLRPPSAR